MEFDPDRHLCSTESDYNKTKQKEALEAAREDYEKWIKEKWRVDQKRETEKLPWCTCDLCPICGKPKWRG